MLSCAQAGEIITFDAWMLLKPWPSILHHQRPSGRSAVNRGAMGSVKGRAIELFKNGATGLWNLSIVCPGAPKPTVGSNPEVAAAVKSGLTNLVATKKLSSGSA